jgi:hypothetical protein
MNYYLLVFDRRNRRLVEEVKEFDDAVDAVRARFRREASDAVDGSDLEVVVLGAASRKALENTHSRYFGSGRELSLT